MVIVSEALFEKIILKKYRLIIWGKGFKSRDVIDFIDTRICCVMGWFDRKYDKGIIDGERFYSADEFKNEEYDYVVITPIDTDSICKDDLYFDLPPEKMIFFWEVDLDKYPFFDKEKAELRKETRRLNNELANIRYELGLERTPNIYSIEDTLTTISNDRKSLCRFGDGEMRWIVDSKKAHARMPVWFQSRNSIMETRLREIITSNDSGVIIAISDIFGALEDFVEDDKAFYRELFNTDDFRERIMTYINFNTIYGNAFVTRPYWHFPNKNKDKCRYIFSLWKNIWDDRDIVLVEGEFVRMGMGNDLLTGARSVKRIICPHKDAFQFYDEILNAVCEIAEKNNLILIALGPTATIMAYDLAMEGYQAIDIGQLDSEYEWYQRGSVDRVAIEGKGIAESDKGRIPHSDVSSEYYDQICKKIRTIDADVQESTKVSSL